MELLREEYFWQRAPRWLSRLAVGSAAAAAAIAIVVGGIAAAAQSRMAQLFGYERYSVTMHVVAMVFVAALAVGIATALLQLGRAELAGIVLVAAVLGPMTIVAAPVRESMVATNFSDTRTWWHLVVAGLLLAIVVPWTWFANRCLAERDTSAEPAIPQSWVLSWLAPDALFFAVAALGVNAYVQLPQQSNAPATAALLGWAALAAGMTVAVAYGRRWWTVFAALGSAALVLSFLFLAYTRLGGWPGVAGWEGDMQSPIITSVASTLTLLVAPLLGLALRPVTRLASLASGGSSEATQVLAS